DDWKLLEKLFKFLDGFEHITKWTEAHNSSIWQALPCIDYLLQRFNSELNSARESGDHAFAAMIKIGWESLDKYFQLTECSAVYAFAMVLNPRFKWLYFEQKWKSEWIQYTR
ncbi:hypothetical protein BDD12DRAFT_690114, partial [Trichophaea hybrida]